MMPIKKTKILKWFLFLVALHSFIVGIGLICITNQLRILLGFSPSMEQFFQTQGGIFHIVMAIAYTMGGYNQQKYYSLITFAIIVKLCASVFLFTYYTLINSSLLILLSGVTDFIILIVLIVLTQKIKKGHN